MPNDNRVDKKISINDYRVAIDKLDIIERAAGMIFFDQLSRDKLDTPLALPADFKEEYKSDHKTRKNN